MGLFDKSVPERRNDGVNTEIAQFERELVRLDQNKQDLTFQLGAQFVELNDLQSVAGTAYEPLFLQIEQIDKAKVVLNKRILAVQGLRKCEHCENILPLESAFCNKCGERLNPLFENYEVRKKVCTNCGAQLEEAGIFCTSCGARVASNEQ